jgi:hypothetical protein
MPQEQLEPALKEIAQSIANPPVNFEPSPELDRIGLLIERNERLTQEERKGQA